MLRRQSVIETLHSDDKLSYADVARLFDITRERVRQIAHKYTDIRKPRSPRRCLVCGQRITKYIGRNCYKQGYCRPCWTIHKKKKASSQYSLVLFSCELCGRVFYRPAQEVKYLLKKGKKPRFDSRVCLALSNFHSRSPNGNK